MTEQHQRGQDSRRNNKDDSVLGNVTSLTNIIHDIISMMNYQVLGNCDVLLHMTEQSSRNDGLIVPVDGEGRQLSDEPIKKNLFQADQINALIKNPVKLALGRINGLKKVVAHLEEQLRNQQVSTGKKE